MWHAKRGKKFYHRALEPATPFCNSYVRVYEFQSGTGRGPAVDTAAANRNHQNRCLSIEKGRGGIIYIAIVVTVPGNHCKLFFLIGGVILKSNFYLCTFKSGAPINWEGNLPNRCPYFYRPPFFLRNGFNRLYVNLVKLCEFSWWMRYNFVD